MSNDGARDQDGVWQLTRKIGFAALVTHDDGKLRAPGAGLFGLPSGPNSSLAWATTSGADCACDVEVASCVTVKAVVASSTMRRFVMMSLVPGKILAATNSLSSTYWTTVSG
jgi:hypothetical protein